MLTKISNSNVGLFRGLEEQFGNVLKLFKKEVIMSRWLIVLRKVSVSNEETNKKRERKEITPMTRGRIITSILIMALVIISGFSNITIADLEDSHADMAINEECDLDIMEEPHIQSAVNEMELQDYLAYAPKKFGMMKAGKTTANDKTVAYCLTIKYNKIYVGGATYQDDSWDAYICRFDIDGGGPVLKWERSWDLLGYDEGIRGLVYDAGKIYAVGHSNKGGGRQILLKVDGLTGSVDTYRVSGSDSNPKVGQAIEYWYDGYLYSTGSRKYDDGLYRVVINKYSTNLDFEWGYYLNPFLGGPEYGYDLDVSNGYAYITGICHYVGHEYQFYPFMLKFDVDSPNVIWSNSYGCAWWSIASLSCLRDGNRVYYTGVDLGQSASNDVYFAYIRESDGWQDGTVDRCWGGYYDDDVGNDIIEYADQFYVTGTTESYGAGGFDALLLKVDLSFNEIWFETWGDSQDEEALNAFEYGGDIYIVGCTDSFGSGSRNAFLLKYSSSGDLVWDKVWSHNHPPPDPVIELTPSSRGFGWVKKGKCSSEEDFYLENVGTQTATGTVSLKHDDVSHFTITEGEGGFSLDPGATDTIKVKFCPKSLGRKNTYLYAEGLNCNNDSSSLGGRSTIFDWNFNVVEEVVTQQSQQNSQGNQSNPCSLRAVPAFPEEAQTDQSTEVSPESPLLLRCYPNPFNPETEISYTLPSDCHVKLSIYNLLGQRIKTLVDAYQATGHRTVHWNGTDENGNAVSSAVYFYRLKAGELAESRKMILMR